LRTRLLPALFLVLALLFPAVPAGADGVPPGGREGGTRAASADALYAGRFGVASSQFVDYDTATKRGELAAMEGAGIGWVRCGFIWSNLEPVRGVWVLGGADEAVGEAERSGAKVLGIMGGSPFWANGGMPWMYPPTDLEAWRDYVRTLSSRYRGRVAAWEIWNEENILPFWQPQPDPAYYVQLLSIASQEIRSADPGAVIVMGGLAGPGVDYLEECLKLGAAEYVDAVAYHPYPETMGIVGSDADSLYRPKEALCRLLVDYVHNLVARYTSRDIRIWITEVGWTTCSQSPPGVDEPTQASYLLRTLVNYATTDVERVFWFNLRDTMVDEFDHLGLLRNDFSRKPSYAYYRTFQQVFGRAVEVEPDAVSFRCGDASTLEAHCFRRDDGTLAFAAWKSDDASDLLDFTVNLDGIRSAYLVEKNTGERLPLAGDSTGDSEKLAVTALPVGKDPVVVELDYREPEPVPSARTTFYFAEGYTGEGFEEWLCLLNPQQGEAKVHITYFFEEEAPREQDLKIPAGARRTLFVNREVGEGKNVSVRVSSDLPVVAERPMYFNYRGAWTGGHDVVGLY